MNHYDLQLCVTIHSATMEASVHQNLDSLTSTIVNALLDLTASCVKTVCNGFNLIS